MHSLWIGSVEAHEDVMCLRTKLRLESRTIDLNPPLEYNKICALLGHPDDTSWRLMNSAKRLAWATRVLRTAEELCLGLDDTYHRETFVPCGEIFSHLKSWRVDNLPSSSEDPNASSFVVQDGNWICPPTYNRFGTRTGRLVVSSGPRVLTVRQSTRERFRSIDDDHILVSLDFSSLEARIALSLAGKQVEVAQDPYQFICDMLRLKTRDEAKNATFSAIYSDPTSDEKIDVKVSMVRRMFKLGEMYSKLSNERAINSGRVRNLYRRSIDVSGEETLYNNYVQSTGADVVLHGFNSMLKHLEDLKVVPHFLLHDALFASVPRRVIEDVERMCASGVRVPRMDCVFPLKMTVVGERPIITTDAQ